MLMKKLYIKLVVAGLLVGLALGFAQTAITYVKTDPGPDRSMFQSDYVERRHFYKGWPLATKATSEDSNEKIPANAQTYANIAILAVATPVLFVALGFVLCRIVHDRRAAKFIAIGLVLGTAAGVSQVWYTSQRQHAGFLYQPAVRSDGPCFTDSTLAECRVCPTSYQGNLCVAPAYQTSVRGWPLKHDTYDSLGRYDVSPSLLFNFLILSTMGGVIGGAAAKLTSTSTPKKKSVKKIKPAK